MGILAWIVFGAGAGIVAGIITGDERSGCLYNVIIGVIGAFVGGFIMQFITGENFSIAWNLRSFIVAVLGAVLLLVISGAARGKR